MPRDAEPTPTRPAICAPDPQLGRRPHEETFARNRRDEEVILDLWTRHGDIAARNEIVLRYRPMIERMARRRARHCGNAIPVEDFRQAGMLALIDAAETFDPVRSPSFATHATNVVTSALLRMSADTLGPTRVATNIDDKRVFFKFYAVAQAITQREGRRLAVSDAPEIARTIGVPESAVRRMMPRLIRRDRSLDECRAAKDAPPSEIAREPSWTYDEGVVAPSDPEAEVAARHDPAKLAAALRDAFAILEPKELRVIELRWFTREDRTLPFAAVGAEVRYSRKHVRTIEIQAMMKLKRHLEQRGITLEALGAIDNAFMPYGQAPLSSRA